MRTLVIGIFLTSSLAHMSETALRQVDKCNVASSLPGWEERAKERR